MFFEKPVFFSQEESTFSTFWEILLNQLHPTTIFLSLAVFKKVNFFQKTLYFTWKKPNFEHFEKFILSVAMYSEFATFSNFSLKKVFVRNEPIYVFQRPYFLNVLKFLTCSVAFYCKFAHSASSKKNPKTFRKSQLLFLNKKPKFFTFLRNLITPVAFYSKLAAVGNF